MQWLLVCKESDAELPPSLKKTIDKKYSTLIGKVLKIPLTCYLHKNLLIATSKAVDSIV